MVPTVSLALSNSLTLASGRAKCGGASRRARSKRAVSTCWLVGDCVDGAVALEREDAEGEVVRGSCEAKVCRCALRNK